MISLILSLILTLDTIIISIWQMRKPRPGGLRLTAGLWPVLGPEGDVIPRLWGLGCPASGRLPGGEGQSPQQQSREREQKNSDGKDQDSG